MCYLIWNEKQSVISVFKANPDSYDFNLSNNPTEIINTIKWVTKEEFLSGEFTTYHESLNKLIKNTDI